MTRPSTQWQDDLRFVLRHNTSLFASAADQPSQLGALIVYLNDLRSVLATPLGEDADTLLSPLAALTDEIGRLQSKQSSLLLRPAPRAGTPLSPAERVLRLNAVLAVKILRRAGIQRKDAEGRVAKLLHARGFRSRKRDDEGFDEIRGKSVSRWVDAATPMGVLSDVHAEVRNILGEGFPANMTHREATDAVQYLIDRLQPEAKRPDAPAS